MIVVTGAGGQLGSAFARMASDSWTFLTRDVLDLAELDTIAPTITKLNPSAVINCAAYTAVDRAERDEALVMRVNGLAVERLADVTGDLGVPFVTFSTDYVFDGTKGTAYVESDERNPINVYGRSKALGEDLALRANPNSLVVRTSWLFSSSHRNFVTTILGHMEAGDVTVVTDQIGSPTAVDDLARATAAALEVGATGVLHLTNQGETSWYDLAVEIAELAGIDGNRVHPCTTDERPTPARRPARSVLASDRLRGLGLSLMDDYREPLRRAVAAIRQG